MSQFLTEFILVTSLQLFVLIMPGPDYILVVSNATFNSRRHGIFTGFGITCGFTVLLIACMSGLALIVKESALLYSLISWFGAGYLLYLGSSLWYQTLKKSQSTQTLTQIPQVTYWQSWRQGMLCNLLNPKALLFLFGLFTLVINEHTPISWQVSYAAVMIINTFIWFYLVSILVTHPMAERYLHRVQHWIQPILGTLLILYAILIIW